jgi:hypothetical protein
MNKSLAKRALSMYVSSHRIFHSTKRVNISIPPVSPAFPIHIPDP